MGTRGLIAFKSENIYKGSYNHYDSYFEGLGQEIVNAIQVVIKAEKLHELRQAVNNVMIVNSQDAPSVEWQEYYKKFHGLGNERYKTEWYALLRELQGADIIPHLVSGEVKHMTDDMNFWNNKLSCEYSYVINFDDNSFEVYTDSSNHIKTFPLRNIPEDWIKQCEKVSNNE